MKIKTQTLTGAALDWAVAKCEGIALALAPFRGAKNFVILGQNMKPTSSQYLPSSAWAQGGPIIERECIALIPLRSGWSAQAPYDYVRETERPKIYGPTPLIAAMRCFVASNLGNEVDVPNEVAA